jgi:uncharacterized protein YdeI (YjbR/CyaY-like superfamily)
MPKIREDASSRIDQYIARAAPFARPICRRLRKIIHKADAGIVEDWKWGPNFNKAGMVCGIWAFKSHVSLTFFQGALLKDPKKILIHGAANAQNRAVRFMSPGEIPERTLLSYVREAVRNNERGLKAIPLPKVLKAPPDFRKALDSRARAKKFFDALSYTHRKDYIVWITSARRAETRARRITLALAMLSAKQTTRERTGCGCPNFS